MTVRVLFFSLLREVTGEREIWWELPGDSASVAELLESLYRRWPELREWDRKILVAVDLHYVKRDEGVSEGQEVAIMPPVQGG